MKFRVTGRDELGQTVVREVAADSEDEALAFAVLAGTTVDSLERLGDEAPAQQRDPPGTRDAGLEATTANLRNAPTDAVPSNGLPSAGKKSLLQRFWLWLPFGVLGGVFFALGLFMKIALDSQPLPVSRGYLMLTYGLMGGGIIVILFGLSGKSLREFNRRSKH
jgi:hypothetical protein